MIPVKSVKTIKQAKTDLHKKERYFEALGRRKTAIVRVRLFTIKAGKIATVSVNEKPLDVYFPLKKLQDVAIAPFRALSINEHSVTAHASGGGIKAQAEAMRLGIARALVSQNSLWRTKLKALGYLKRDPRMVERKHPGMRKARRPQQWRKR